MSLAYEEFLTSKQRRAGDHGHKIDPADVNPTLHGFQREIVQTSVRAGRFGVWTTTGTGKTLIQLEYARLSGKRSLIVAPLAVCQQTSREAASKLDVEARYVRSSDQITGPGMWVTNHEMHDRFDPHALDVVVLDEGSILADSTGKTRTSLIEHFAPVPRRMTCTATPRPNDVEELTNQAAFLGVCSRADMLATYFIHDDKGWRLKGHARDPLFKWMATWAIALRKPSDMGYPDDGYDLPDLEIIPEFLPVRIEAEGQLFPTDLGGVSGRARVRRETLQARCERAAELVMAEPGEPWLLWCGLNAEAGLLAKLLPGAVNIHGSLSAEAKAEGLLGFADGDITTLITKPSIASRGLNWQHCARMAFVGLSDCYDDQTEVLTRAGWKSFAKVTMDDDLATVNPDTNGFEWQAPLRVVWEPYEGPMLHFHGQRNFDLLVTPNHRLYTQRCPTRFPGDASGWQLRYADDIARRFRRSEFRMMSAPPTADGHRPKWIRIPPYGRLNLRSRVIERLPAEDFMRLAGWYLSEGYCRPIDSAERGRIVICQSDQNPENRAEIIGLMIRSGLHVNARSKDITGYSVNLAAYLIDQFGSGSHAKRVPRWVKDLHPDLLTLLRDTMIKGDGSHRDGIARCYTTASAQLADDFQEIALRTGIRASVRLRHCYSYSTSFTGSPVYEVGLAWNRTRPSIHKEPERVRYDGMVGCAEVPNHTLIVRRNGIPVVSGNSYQDYYQAIRRCYRYGQARIVRAHIVLSELESQIAASVARKEREADAFMGELVGAMQRARREEAAA